MKRFLFLLLFLSLLTSCVPAKQTLDASPLSGVWKGSTQCLTEMEYVMRISGSVSGEITANVVITGINKDPSKNLPEKMDLGSHVFRGFYYEDLSFAMTQEPLKISAESAAKSPQGKAIVDMLNENRQTLKGNLLESGMELNMQPPGPACEPFIAVKIG